MPAAYDRLACRALCSFNALNCARQLQRCITKSSTGARLRAGEGGGESNASVEQRICNHAGGVDGFADADGVEYGY